MQPVPTEAFHWPRLLSKVLNMQNNKLESTHIITETILHSSLAMCMQRPFTRHPHYTEPHSSLPKSRRETTNPANHVCDWDSADWCLNPHTHCSETLTLPMGSTCFKIHSSQVTRKPDWGAQRKLHVFTRSMVRLTAGSAPSQHQVTDTATMTELTCSWHLETCFPPFLSGYSSQRMIISL